MLRFIFVCMGVVALSLIAIAGQFVMDGVSDATDTVIARNAVIVEQEQDIAMDDASIAEQLNAIETTAGAVAFDPNDTFSGGFTNEAPKALQDAQPSMDEQAN